MTINDIKTMVRANGSHWFDPDTMRTFGTHVYPTVYQGRGGIYFVTSEDTFDRESKEYVVRKFTGSSIDTVSRHHDKDEAVEVAKDSAIQDEHYTEVKERYEPVTNLEQFAHDLRQHGGKPSGNDMSQIISYTAAYHKLMEEACNGDVVLYDNDKPTKQLSELQRLIEASAKNLGCGVRFSGDPRGCTVKLIMPDGFTNDFGQEGYCIPIDKP